MDNEPLGPDSGRELRRSYHDRIADLREQARLILHRAGLGTERATDALLGEDPGAVTELRADADAMQAVAGAVDEAVVNLLATEAPVARDLRVILAARDVAQLGLLCSGLTVALAGRAGGIADQLSPTLPGLIRHVGAATAELLRLAETAWVGLDQETAIEVEARAAQVKHLHTGFMAALIGLNGVPMEAAMDLAMAARAYERLADHSVETAERVLFAVGAAGLSGRLIGG
ncbi:MAG TPA: PhoU domain-containing protein [Acidimicrobiales bacterium]|nr:PhoU domain-containing protein [Acidimicrobiales bacterium]